MVLLESFFNFTETFGEEIDLMLEITISLHLVLHKLYGVEHGGMAPVYGLPDSRQGLV